MALEQTDLLDEFEVQKKLAEAEWDAKNLLGRLDVVPRGFVFHRAAWDEAVSVLFRNQYIRSPLRVLKANGHDSKTEQGLSVWDVEPVYGNPISQSWEIVNRNLYKYAFM
jgi:hypothetical protein